MGLDGDASDAGERMLSTSAVARMLGVSRQAVQARAQRQTLRAYKIDGVWRIPESAASALVDYERQKAVFSGQVRPLRSVVSGEGQGIESVSDAFEEMRVRVQRLERAADERERVFREAELAVRELALRDAELARLRDDRRRLRAALRLLLDDDEA